MGSLAKPYTFVAAAPIVAAQSNSDFDTLYNWVNTAAIWSDASVAFTGVPSGPNTDPTAPNHLVRKQYADNGLWSQNKGAAPSGQFSCLFGDWTAYTPNGSGVFTITFGTGFVNITNGAFLTTTTAGVYCTVTSATKTALTCKAVTMSTGAAYATALQVAFVAFGH